ncbi:MAG: hypothetical protein ABFC78_05365, partial [Methanoregula sp.]
MKKGDKNFIDDLIERNPDFEVDKLKAIEQEIEKIASSIHVPAELIQKNSSINPIKQQKLFDLFSTTPDYIPIPNHPHNAEFYTNLCNIYQAINQFFLQKKKEDKSHLYFGTLTTNWINEKSFSELIKFKLNNVEKKTK